MTFSTSLVAVWYSSNSCRSVVRCAQLVEQPRILHRDHRLRGEAFHQRDLPVGERPHFLPIHGNQPEHRCILAKRHG